jgi:hypothetical protein
MSFSYPNQFFPMEFTPKQQALANALVKSYRATGEFDEDDIKFAETPTKENKAQMDILIAALESEGVTFPDAV